MPKLDDVARAAGVSKATASRALSGAEGVSPTTRARVERAAGDLGFRASGAARRLATGLTRTIGVLTPSVPFPQTSLLFTCLFISSWHLFAYTLLAASALYSHAQ